MPVHLSQNEPADDCDVPLQSVESESDFSEDNTTPSVERQRTPSVVVQEAVGEAPSRNIDSEDNLRDQFENLAVTSDNATPQRSRRSSSAGLRAPVTARGLYNATPRTSPSPSPGRSSTSASRQATPANTIADGVPLYEANALSTSSEDGAPDIGRLDLHDRRTPYSVREESLPKEPFFDPAFQNALKAGISLAKRVSDDLAHCGIAHKPGSNLNKIWKTAQDLAEFKSPATRTIGIVGDSAAGQCLRQLWPPSLEANERL